MAECRSKHVVNNTTKKSQFFGLKKDVLFGKVRDWQTCLSVQLEEHDTFASASGAER
jgi:hypothetical protein